MKYGFGVDLGGTTIKLGYFDENSRLLQKWDIPTNTQDSGNHILQDISVAISRYISENSINKADLLGIGIGVPGPVFPDGTVNKCINLGWGVFNIEKALRDLTGLPVKAGNDANVAALGECRMGSGQKSRNMVLVILGTGVGGGIIINNQLLYGTTGSGGEIGHMVINRQETEFCSCGKRGCVEQYCSATGIVRMAKKYLTAHTVPSNLRDIPDFTCKDVFDAAASGDAAAREILEQAYAYLGEFLANVCDVLNPERVVLGGGVSQAGAPLLEGVKRHFPKYVFHAAADVTFSLATLGNDAGIYGAFQLIKEHYHG